MLESQCENINKIKVVDNSIYVLGQNFNLTQFDIEKGTEIWKAKSLPRDDLDLVPPNDLTELVVDGN